MEFPSAIFKPQKSPQGVSLIIAVFAMMLLAVLGATMAMMISGNFQMNTGNLESEKAFYLADAGIQEALMHLAIGDASFDNDGDYLQRKLGNGEYNVTRQTNDGEVNVTSRGFIPAENNYRSLREVSLRVIPSGLLGVQAFTGGELFDWHGTRGYSISVNGVIGATHYEGNDSNVTPDEVLDRAVPGSGDRVRSQVTLPNISIEDFRSIVDNPPPDLKTVHLYGDQTFSGKNNNLGLIVVEGNVTIDTDIGTKGVDFSHANIIATGNINIIGSGTMSIMAHVNNTGKSYPVLATRFGNITSSAPSGYSAASRKFEGFIFSQYGTVDINCIRGNAIMGYIIRLRGNVELEYDAKRIEMDQVFTEVGGTTIRDWREQ
ncbi:MAG: hypothetical protein KKE64_01990 [Candidatus Omnitrophica bacterium]|nr:hypothetical protein [Candidatus Omnitrophota bacterium]